MPGVFLTFYRRDIMSTKKKVFWITTFIIITAVAIVICINFLIGGQAEEFNGTLVNANSMFQNLL
jgi:hypothetical protein